LAVKNIKSKKNDTGATEVQIKIFTERITSINDHLKTMKKDNSGRRGLLNLVSKRRKLLNYLKKKDLNKYVDVINKLNLRK